MTLRKSSPELIGRFDRAVLKDPAVERRKMFGFPAAFLGGRLFASLHEEDVILRLGEADRGELLRVPGARRFEPRPGRAMGDFVVLAPAQTADDGALAAWIERARVHAASLPPKEKAKAKAKKAKAR
jgi:hypothetical protein